ncbi:hybrid sensor histidine kinase/response regulator [Fulvitalea axinellae]|uniref:histidine kinase n=1 Tax=Fulvitalea axinellae TaxID=1182444 RepID=A0AAU9CK40_9BACT|nr:hybrid sensor histidine kinase/response regulator [Fulvitalea axinellae]
MESTQKILIVDDIAQNIQVAANILKKEHYNITYAQNGKAALRKISKIEFDLILLDVMMPEINGYEVCKLIKASPRTKDTPVIFLTAKAEPTNIVKGFEVGAVDYITKPFNGTELLARVKTQLSLRNTTRELQKANETKNKLFSIIGHDLRGLIGNIKNIFDVLTSRYYQFDQERVERLIRLGKDSSASTHNLLENLLCWARSEKGVLGFVPRHCDITIPIRDAMDLFSATADHKKINIQWECEEDEVFAYFDEDMIRTVIRNLLSNAIKFTPMNGEVRVAVTTNEKMITVEFTDNGIGVDFKNIQKILSRDLHYTTEGTEGEKGTGLGLLLVKNFVEKNKGKLTIESVLDEGSLFRFTLPRQPVNVKPDGETENRNTTQVSIPV